MIVASGLESAVRGTVQLLLGTAGLPPNTTAVLSLTTVNLLQSWVWSTKPKKLPEHGWAGGSLCEPG